MRNALASGMGSSDAPVQDKEKPRSGWLSEVDNDKVRLLKTLFWAAKIRV